MDAVLQRALHDAPELVWLPDHGLGYQRVLAPKADYFDDYAEKAVTDTGKLLVQFRVGFVAKYYKGQLIDVGSCTGSFINAWEADMGQTCRGHDIDQKAIAWLQQRGRYVNLNLLNCIPALTLWDCFEHLNEPGELLWRITPGGWVFMTLPIFGGFEEVKRSKHYKPKEHCWYFTEPGLQWFMEQYGFKMVEAGDPENAYGRVGVGTFAFQKIAPGVRIAEILRSMGASAW